MKQLLSMLLVLVFAFDGMAARIRKPAPPSGLYVTSDTQVVAAWVYWTDNSNNETSFVIQRSAMSIGPWVTIGITNVPAWVMQQRALRAFKDVSVQTGGTYFYRVYASNQAGTSSPSSVGSVTIGSSVVSPTNSTPTLTKLTNAVLYSSTIAAATAYQTWQYYYLDLPASVSSLTVNVTGLTGDVDLFTRYNASPTTNSYGCVSRNYGTNSELCTISSPSAGRWYFGVLNSAVGTFTYNVTATYVLATSTACVYSLTPGRAVMTDAGGTTNATVTAPAGCPWNIYPSLPTWVTASALSGSGTSTVTFTVAASTDSADRRGLIYFYDPFGKWSGAYFTIDQAGSGCAVELFPASRFVSSGGGLGQLGVQTYINVVPNSTNVDVATSNGGGKCAVVASSDSSWLLLNSVTNGFTPMEISYLVEPNPTNGVRSAYIDVDGEIFAIHQSPNETNSPTTPVGLASTALSSTALYLSWTASTDDDRIRKYRIFRDGNAIDETATAYVTLAGLPEGASACYQVQAQDVNGNMSALSTNRCVSPLPSSQRLLPVGFQGAPPAFSGYRPVRELPPKANIAFLRANFVDHVTNSLVREYYEDRWLDPTTTSSAASVWRNQSYGMANLRGDVFDYITLPIAATTNSQAIVTSLYDTMMAAGVDLKRYDGYVLDVPVNTLFNMSPSITLDGKRFWTVPMWGGFPAEFPRISRNGLDVRNNDGIRYPHNFGHYLNFNEGGGIISTNNDIISTNGNVSQAYFYDEAYSPMGSGIGYDGPRAHFLGPHKDYCGWIKPQLVTATGAYTLNPYHLPASTNKAVKVPCGNQVGFWWVEYRLPDVIISYDNTASHSPVFLLNCRATNTTVFLDALANMMAGAGLAVGNSFTDSWNGTVITATSTNATAAVVTITLGTGDSTPPTIAITSPATGTSFQGAIPIYYTATDNKLLTGFELYEDGLLKGRYHHPTCESQTNIHSPFVFCQTNVSSWVYYQPSSLGSHVVTMKVWDTVSSAVSAVTLTATTDTTPTREVFTSPTNNQTLGTNQAVVISYVTTPDPDIAMMRLFADNTLVGFTHVGFVSYANAYDVSHSLGSRTWYMLDSRFRFDDQAALNNGDVDQNGNPKAPPHRLRWNTLSEESGEHTLTLEVEDFAGNILRRTITVSTIP